MYLRNLKRLGLNLRLIVILIIFVLPTFLGAINQNYLKKTDKIQNDSLNSYSSIHASSSSALNTNYFLYYKEFIIDHNKVIGSGNHSNFPLLIDVFDQDLHDDVQPDGDDIAFANETEWLNYDLEQFNKNYNSTHAHLVAWVKIPTLATNVDTILYMYFGNTTMLSQENPANVWSTYSSVWHLEESSGIGAYLKDSTTNNYDGTPSGTQYLSSGRMGGARNFIADSDRISITSGSNLFDGSNRFVFSFWMFPNYATDLEWENDGERNVFYKFSSVRMARTWRYSFQSSGRGRFQTDIQFVSHGTIYPNVEIYRRTWNYIVYSYDGSYFRAYVNGQQVSSSYIGSDSLISDSSNFLIGSMGSNCFYGYIDEFRISNTVNINGWYETEYNNQNSPSSFYSVSNAKKVYASVNDFGNFKVISIDHTKVSGTDDLIDFPLLISIFDSDLHSKTQVDGDDIAFSDISGIEWLAHEIEFYNRDYNTTHARLIAWVRIPVLSVDIDTEIRMYYGNSSIRAQQFPKAVWNENYFAVWHLKENPIENIYDSTVHNYDGISSGAMNSFDQVEGKIDGSLDFDGNNDHVQIGNIPSNNWNAITIEAWIRMDDTGDDRVISKEEGTGGGPHIWMLGKSNFNLKCRITTDGVDGGFSEILSTGGLEIGTWHYIAMKWDATTKNFIGYIDGSSSAQIQRLGDTISDSIVDTIIADQAAGVRQFDGIISEVRLSNYAYSDEWIETQFTNQYSPNLFYSVGSEQTKIITLSVNTLDLYGNSIPNLNVSIYQQDEYLDSSYSDSTGIASFQNINQGDYNFTVKMQSNIGTQIELVNKTSHAFNINEVTREINLVCNISSNFFQVTDVDQLLVSSGWIIVGNNSENLMNCTINQNGFAQFWWVNITPYDYNYSLYYEDNNYNPSIILLSEGIINQPNKTIQIQVNLTTVSFTIKGSGNLVSGAKLILKRVDNGISIANLTTGETGTAILRWVNSSGLLKGSIVNYSLEIEFFGSKLFNSTTGGIPDTFIYNFTVISNTSYEFIININPDDYQTELISLNPNDNIIIEWGTQLKIRTLFNVSKAGIPPIVALLGPAVADFVHFRVFDGAIVVLTGDLKAETEKIGRYQGVINTKLLDSDKSYLIEITALKSGFKIPIPINLLFFISLKHFYINESSNNDSLLDVYWLEFANMSLKSYGEDYEEILLGDNIFIESDDSFRFFIPNIAAEWNLTIIRFTLKDITFGVSQSNIYVNITDPYGIIHSWDETKGEFYYAPGDPGNGYWNNLEIELNGGSVNVNNIFDFSIEGTFSGPFQVITEAIFIRNSLNVQYQQFNVTNFVKIPYNFNGWGIKNITFELLNCHDPNTWASVNPANIIENITTNEGYLSYYIYDANLGYGKININNTVIYPLDGFYSFYLGNTSDILFDLNIYVEYYQEYYKNDYLEFLNTTNIINNYQAGNLLQISPNDFDWNEIETIISINNLRNENLSKVFPSEVILHLIVGGQDYEVQDSLLNGTGSIMLYNLNKDYLFSGLIQANQSISLDLSFQIRYIRTVQYNLEAIINYQIKEAPSITGSTLYNYNTQSYNVQIDTSLLNSFSYTVRFTSAKDHYDVGIKELNLNVLERITMMNNSLSFYQTFINIYIRQSINFSLSYIDVLLGINIGQLATQEYIWEYYGEGSTIIANGQGNLINSLNNDFILDFNTESRSAGRYSIIATLDKENYQTKIAVISLTILKRPISYLLDYKFKNNLINVIKGNTISIELNLTDSINYFSPLENATISLIINGVEYQFGEYDDGLYRIIFPTDNIDAFFTSNTLIGIINISKEDYISQEFSITIVVEMEQIFPGVPTFYFILISSFVISFLGIVVGYRVYKVAKIPKFVKKARALKKIIKNDKTVLDSILYSSKNVILGELMKGTWNNLGISIESILGVEVKKSKKLEAFKKKFSRKIRSSDQKPVGLILMRWNERSGTEIMTKYPEEATISPKTLMQIYSTHEYSGDKGIITLTDSALNIVSYYSGPDSGYYLILLLNIDDDPDMYEAGMVDTLHLIVKNLEDNAYLTLFPSLFRRLSVYPSLNDEQIIALNYQDEIKHNILEILREEGVVAKSELVIWLKDKMVSSFFDIDAILMDLMKIELIRQISIKGVPSELIMLINDIFMFRMPPLNLLKNTTEKGLPASLSQQYNTDVKEFFKNYHPSEEDNIKIASVLIDPQAYEILKLLRTSIVTQNELEKLKKKGVEDIYSSLKVLWDNQLIKVYQDKNKNEYYALLSDFYIDSMFPKYLLNIISSGYEQRSKANKILIEYLNVLEDVYFNLKKQ